MPTNYPGAIDSFTNPTETDTLDDPPHADQHTDKNDAIEAVETELGINPRGTHADVRTRFDEQLGLLGREIFTADGNFEKANWPGIKKALVKAQAGGGGGGPAAATGGSEVSAGSGGSGGNYAESLLLESALAASEAVTVGDGGAGGSPGGDSSFGTHVVAKGGVPAGGSGAQSGVDVRRGTAPSTGSDVGELVVEGGAGGGSYVNPAALTKGVSGSGGDSVLGSGGRQEHAVSGGSSGKGFGGGGSGAANSSGQSLNNGAAGSNGIVIVEVYGSPS